MRPAVVVCVCVCVSVCLSACLSVVLIWSYRAMFQHAVFYNIVVGDATARLDSILDFGNIYGNNITYAIW